MARDEVLVERNGPVTTVIIDRASDRSGPRGAGEARSQLLFGEFAKFVGNGPDDTQRHRAVADRRPAEAIADPVDGAIGRVTRQAPPCAGTALLVVEPEGEFQLQLRMLRQMRHGDRQ